MARLLNCCELLVADDKGCPDCRYSRDFFRDAHFSLVNDVDTTISNGNFLVDDQESQNEFKTSNSNMHNPG